MEGEKLRKAIADCDKEIERLETELKDVLTNVETPYHSDVDGEEVDEPGMEGVNFINSLCVSFQMKFFGIFSFLSCLKFFLKNLRI